MTPRGRAGLVAAAWFAAAIGVTPAIAAVTGQGGGAPGGGPAAPFAISLEPGDNSLVSLDSSGVLSDEAAVSPDGQWVAYRTTLGGTSPTDRVDSVLLADRSAGTTTRIFPGSGGQAFFGLLDQPTFGTLEGPVVVEEPSVSGDGSMVAFEVTYPAEPPTILLWRRGTGLTSPLSGELGGNVPGLSNLGYSALHHPRLSADGSVLAFQSDGYSNEETEAFPAGFYVLVLATGQVEAVSAATGSTDPGRPGGQYGSIAVSNNGSVVAFASAQYLGDTSSFGNNIRGFNLTMQIWERDRSTLTTTLVSAVNGLPSTGVSDHPALSSDGRVVAFESRSTDLVFGDTNGASDIFSLAPGLGLRRISTAPDGTEANAPSAWPTVSADGLSIGFASAATNLVPGNSNGVYDLFVAGPQSDRLARVSVGFNSTEADGESLRPSFAANARLIFFESSATNLLRRGMDKDSDIFVRDRRPPQPPQPSPSPSPSPSPTPTPTPVVKPAIVVSPDPVDFGSVPIGTLGVKGGATILSVGTGPVQIGAVAISGQDAGDFLLSANPCTGTTLAPAASCPLGLLFIGTATGTRTALLSVASNAGPPEVVRLVAAVGVGILRLDPPMGPPGIVTIATGKGFPPNAPAVLTWSVGLTSTPLEPTFTDATGSFTAQVLVLPHDREGRRTLRAVVTLSGVPATPATAPFLVVSGTAVPPVSGLVQVFRDSLGQPIIIRR